MNFSTPLADPNASRERHHPPLQHQFPPHCRHRSLLLPPPPLPTPTAPPVSFAAAAPVFPIPPPVPRRQRAPGIKRLMPVLLSVNVSFPTAFPALSFPRNFTASVSGQRINLRRKRLQTRWTAASFAPVPAPAPAPAPLRHPVCTPPIAAAAAAPAFVLAAAVPDESVTRDRDILQLQRGARDGGREGRG